MSADWSLPKLLAGLHATIQQQLSVSRDIFGHPVAKGDASEAVWLELLKTYLPARYSADKATVVDSEGRFSDQIDVVIYDRQYSPFILSMKDQLVVPAESVYAVFEAKQEIDAEVVGYARRKALSVRELTRTSLPVPTAAGILKPKPLHRILAGVLTLESGWKPVFGDPIKKALGPGGEADSLELGCVAAHGHFVMNEGQYVFISEGKPATAFLFELIANLQAVATVPMIDIRAYAKWLVADVP